MIPRLTAPKIIKADGLPSFGSICTINGDARNTDDSSIPLSSINNVISLSALFDSTFNSGTTSVPRAIFLGEQHHQPKVLSAQLQIIHQLFQSCKEPKKVHVVLEHWSLIDQPAFNHINSQNADELDTQALIANEDSTSEGFSASHYLTIVKLVRELGGKIWAGFPPRPWAKLVSKAVSDDVFDQVKALDQERYSSHGGKDATDIITPLSDADYKYIAMINWPHRTYLKSMFNPDERPRLPTDDIEKDPPLEKRGFTAAQALKDTFFAHVISEILNADEDNIVLAIAGLGHCEWGFGAPERVRSMTNINPFLIMTKPDDASYWTAQTSPSDPASILQSPQWHVRQADAIVLYEWVD